MSAPTGLDGPPVASNAYRLLWAGFMAILAAGTGFAIRGGILDNWGSEFGFSATELGKIGGAGFTGFCFGIIIGGVIVDRIGYGKLVAVAFLLHVVSAGVAFLANPADPTLTGDAAPDAAKVAAKASGFNYLFWGTFIFVLANGTLEAVANPLVATLFPHNRTHYLNILHASWPLGMIFGGVVGWYLDDQLKMPWKQQLAIYLVPTLVYGLMFLGQSFPQSEATKKGLSLGQMLQDVGFLGGLIVCYLLALFFGQTLEPLLAPVGDAAKDPAVVKKAADLVRFIGYGIGGALLLTILALTRFVLGSLLLFVLFIAHLLIGAVELGTDGWIQNITGNILSSQEGKVLFVFTSLVMFMLRFCADFIERRIGLSPIGILFVCALLGCAGLNLTSRADSFKMAMIALTVYGIGKTFFWPTMLAVVSDRFPRTGAVAISIMGGIGMMSAGILGSQGLGYAKDRFAAEALKEKDPAIFEKYKGSKPSSFVVLPPEVEKAKLPEIIPIDGGKLGEINDKLGKARDALASVAAAGPALATLNESVERLQTDAKVIIAATAKESSEDKALPGKVAKEQLDKAAKLTEPLLRLISARDELAKVVKTEPTGAIEQLSPDERAVFAASIAGDRKTLVADSAIPATMAVIYLLLLGYFAVSGGYKPVTVDEE